MERHVCRYMTPQFNRKDSETKRERNYSGSTCFIEARKREVKEGSAA